MKISERLGQQDKVVILTMGALCAGLLGTIDYLTGFEVSFAVFYLIPVSLVSWFAGKRAGVLVSLLSAVIWLAASEFAGQRYSHVAIGYWNSLTRLGFFVVVAYLLSELKQKLDYQATLARTDNLTGAANDRAFYEIAQMELNRARRSGHPFTVAYLDADNFKAVNDRFGHRVGSDLLRLVVERLRSVLRVTDVVARLGGDEFALLLPETGGEQAKVVMRKVQENLVDEMSSKKWRVTFSIGVVTCISPSESIEKIVKIADELMYSVKNEGKNSVRYLVLQPKPVKKEAAGV